MWQMSPTKEMAQELLEAQTHTKGSHETRPPATTSKSKLRRAGTVAVYFLLALCLSALIRAIGNSSLLLFYSQEEAVPPCLQSAALVPKPHPALDAHRSLIFSPEYLERSAHLLSEAVQLPTESFDGQGPVGQDARWDRMFAITSLLERQFPLIYDRLNVTSINTHGRLITWPASSSVPSESELEDEHKPLVLMGHLDTVPVDPSTINQWTHPPWSGYVNLSESDALFGRGSCDCKSIVWGILQSIELLLQGGFEPRRTVIVSLGFDEESSGLNGAGELAGALHHSYGSDGVYAILDEGSSNDRAFGLNFASVGTAEKGYDDIQIEVYVRVLPLVKDDAALTPECVDSQTPGGHSSVPPKHTSIGMLASTIAALEDSASAFQPVLKDSSPFFQQLQCLATHAPDMPTDLRDVIRASVSSPSARKTLVEYLQHLEEDDDEAAWKWLMQTSQAVTLVNGGVKTNALPENALASVNYRIDIESGINQTQAHVVSVLQAQANKFGLGLEVFGEADSAEKGKGMFKARSMGPLEPAPISPTGWLDRPWALLSGSIRHAFGTELIVSPSMSTG